MRDLAALALFCVTLFCATLTGATPPETKTEAPTVVVIRATFVTPDLRCDVDYPRDPEDHTGSQERGAPCQRMTENPLFPWCWKKTEELCFRLSDQIIIGADGFCDPDQPCELEHLFKISFDEPCVHPCNNIKCCTLGTLELYDGNGNKFGFVVNNDAEDWSLYGTCSCTTSGPNTCHLECQVRCYEALGGGYFALEKWGYIYHCGRCE